LNNSIIHLEEDKLPPEDRDDYGYTPKPALFLPPIPSLILTHFFNHPHSCLDRTYFLDSIPKKVLGTWDHGHIDHRSAPMKAWGLLLVEESPILAEGIVVLWLIAFFSALILVYGMLGSFVLLALPAYNDDTAIWLLRYGLAGGITIFSLWLIELFVRNGAVFCSNVFDRVLDLPLFGRIRRSGLVCVSNTPFHASNSTPLITEHRHVAGIFILGGWCFLERLVAAGLFLK
jgi:hypothetical protein